MAASVRFMHNNLIVGKVSYVSSELSGFEVENIYSDYRWKEWICEGSWEILQSNNRIYFDDGSGVQYVTVQHNVSGDSYSTSDLATAIAAALNAVSSNWTASYNSATKKWTIGRSSGTAVLAFSQTTNTMWDLLGYTGSTDTDVGTGTAADEVRIHTSEFIMFDLLTDAIGVQCILMTGDADTEFAWPTDARIRIRGANAYGDDSIWDAFAVVDEDLTIDKNGAYKFFPTANCRYWRIDFYDRTNADGPQFAVNQMFLGPYWEPAEFNFDVGFSKTLVDPRTTVETDSRSRYHRQRRKYWVFSNLRLSNIQDNDREEIERIYSEIGATNPFWIALDPDGEISSGIGELTKFVEFDMEYGSDQVLYKRFNTSLSVREVV